MRVVPVLGPENWVYNCKKKLDFLLSHLYASDASQTYFFTGQVSSMAKVVKENQGNLIAAREEIQSMLESYLRRYFPIAEVLVYIYETDDFHRGELVLSAEVTDENGEKAQLHEVMTKNGTLVRNFLNYQYEDNSL